MAPQSTPPASILIIGSGVFGLSTAYAITQRQAFANTTITVVDRSPFPAPDGFSIDSSRIIRADYSDPAYAALAAQAQEVWRQQGDDELGGQGRYTECGLALVTDVPHDDEDDYVRASFRNVQRIAADAGDADAVQELASRKEIEAAIGTGGGSGAWGYRSYSQFLFFLFRTVLRAVGHDTCLTLHNHVQILLKEVMLTLAF